MSAAIYALSGDPWTNGHMDVFQRAYHNFDKVVIAIGDDSKKSYTFRSKERADLVRKALGPHYKHVKVEAFSGLLVDYAFQNDIHTIVRGVRNSADFDFEQLLHEINQSQQQGIDTFILFADRKLSHVSSSAAKELQRNQAQNILEYVPMVVKRALESAVSKQKIIGVTGDIACGKSYLCNKIREAYLESESSSKMSFTHIDVDDIGHHILEESDEPICRKTRQDLRICYGDGIFTEGDFVDTDKLSPIIFSDKETTAEFNYIMQDVMMFFLRKVMYGKKGLILVDCALLAEAGLLGTVNNTVVVVQCTESEQRGRLEARGYTKQKIKQRFNAQLRSKDKIKLIENSIKEHGYGKIINFDSMKDDPKTLYSELLDMPPW